MTGATWALLADLRARITAYDAAAFVPRPIGQAAPADRQHKLVEIIEVDTAFGDDTTAMRRKLNVERTVLIQAFYQIGTTDADLNAAEQAAGTWFDGLRDSLITYTALTGDGWATERKIRFVGEPVAMGRDGGYLFFQLQIATTIPISVGTTPTPPP